MNSDRAWVPVQPCLGGWCRIRDNCPHYHAAVRLDPAERLCDRGSDGVSSVHAVHVPGKPLAWPHLLQSEEQPA